MIGQPLTQFGGFTAQAFGLLPGFLGKVGFDGQAVVRAVALKHLLRSSFEFVGLVGDVTPALSTIPMIFKRRNVAGSLIGGIKETQELLDFCGEHNIVSDIEIIDMKDINDAYERMLKSDVKYRFVIDMATL